MGLSEQLHSFTRNQFPKEHRMVMRLWRFSWRHSRIISIIALAVLTLPGLAIGFIVGKQMNSVVINNTIPSPNSTVSAPKQSTNYWEPLTPDEIVALRIEFRKMPPEHLNVLCAIPACADLADSLFALVHDLNWTGYFEGAYMSDSGIKAGIEIWSFPGKADSRIKIVEAIERSTKGRLRISSQQWKETPDPVYGNDINLVIGRVK
jgi:hypothetical protein